MRLGVRDLQETLHDVSEKKLGAAFSAVHHRFLVTASSAALKSRMVSLSCYCSLMLLGGFEGWGFDLASIQINGNFAIHSVKVCLDASVRSRAHMGMVWIMLLLHML